MAKNIIIVVSKLNNGGAEKVATNLATKLSEKYNVSLVLFNLEKRDYDYTVPVFEIKELRALGIMNIIGIYKLKKLKKEKNIDCTISFGYKPNLFNVLSKHGGKTIISVRNKISVMDRKFENFLHKKISARLADIIVPVSKMVEYDQYDKFKVGYNKMQTIYNSCDAKKIDKSKKDDIPNEYKDIFKSKNVVINVGRLINQKAQWHLIRAFKEVVNKVPDAKLVIIGRGDLKEYLEKLISDLQLEENVYLLGFDSNPYKYMSKSKIFVLSSLHEGMPNVVLEAMACGLPIISTDCEAGPREILAPSTDIHLKVDNISQEEYGILIPELDSNKYLYNEVLTNEEKMLSDSMLKLLKDENLLQYYINQSKKRIKDFEPNKIIKQWIDLIEKD